jgi:hypothetical protein
MKNPAVPRIALALPLAALAACSSGKSGPHFNGQTDASWETLPAASGNLSSPGFSDYTPGGKQGVYALESTTLAAFDGSAWTADTDLAAPIDDLGSWSGPAWVGDNLYILKNNKVYAYSIAGDSWTTLLDTGVPSTDNAQMAHDDHGNVWTVESDSPNHIVEYDPVANAITTFDSTGLGGYVYEPRVAWDPAAQRLYIGPAYDSPDLYAFDPKTGDVTQKTSVPDVAGNVGTGMGDPFCSDRSGHLYAIGDDGCDASASMFQYDTKTDTWSRLPDVPFGDHGCDGACTVSDDGWLYFTSGDGNNFSRLKLH